MITMFLSLLGVGGLGTLAFFFIPGARGLIGSVLSWITGNPLLAIIVALCVVIYVQHHNNAKLGRVLHSIEVQLEHRTESLGITVQSLEALIRTVRAQTAMIREWAKVADQRQIAAQGALRAAQARGAAAETLAQQIDAERQQRGSQRSACATSESVMNAREAF